MDKNVNMKEREFLKLFSKLTDEKKAEILSFMGLLIRCPGLSEDIKANTPAGEHLPPLETIQALQAKWSLLQSA